METAVQGVLLSSTVLPRNPHFIPLKLILALCAIPYSAGTKFAMLPSKKVSTIRMLF
jgi:hypothetical protein